MVGLQISQDHEKTTFAAVNSLLLDTFGIESVPKYESLGFYANFCLFKVILYGFDPMGFISIFHHNFGSMFHFSNHRTSESK